MEDRGSRDPFLVFYLGLLQDPMNAPGDWVTECVNSCSNKTRFLVPAAGKLGSYSRKTRFSPADKSRGPSCSPPLP